MKAVVWLSVIMSLGLASSAEAQYLWEQSPWRGSLAVTESWGTNQYRIWIDAVGTDERKRPISKWSALQMELRKYCMFCGPKTWGSRALEEEQRAASLKDQHFVPITYKTLIPVNITITGSVPATRRPSWREIPTDSLILVLRDGRRLVGEQPRQLYRLDATLDIPEEIARACRLLAAAMGPRILWTQAELQLLARTNRRYYWDKPTANIFLVPVDNGGRDFTLNDVVTAYVTIRGQRCELTRNLMVSALPR